MKVAPCAIPDVLMVEPQVYRDSRGAFLETYNERAFAAAGLQHHFVQDNLSISKRNVMRGLHYQVRRARQAGAGGAAARCWMWRSICAAGRQLSAARNRSAFGSRPQGALDSSGVCARICGAERSGCFCL